MVQAGGRGVRRWLSYSGDRSFSKLSAGLIGDRLDWAVTRQRSGPDGTYEQNFTG